MKEHCGQKHRRKGALGSSCITDEKEPQGDSPSAMTEHRRSSRIFFWSSLVSPFGVFASWGFTSKNFFQNHRHLYSDLTCLLEDSEKWALWGWGDRRRGENPIDPCANSRNLHFQYLAITQDCQRFSPTVFWKNVLTSSPQHSFFYLPSKVPMKHRRKRKITNNYQFMPDLRGNQW